MDETSTPGSRGDDELNDPDERDDPRRIVVGEDQTHWETFLEVGSQVVAKGDLVVLPTDTVYGVGCDAFNPSAVSKVFEAKGRGRDLPLPVLVHSSRQVLGLVEEIGEQAKTLMAAYWPGPLTIIMREASDLGWNLGSSRGTVALRMPKQPFALALLRRTGPLAVTSANRSGEPTPATVPEIMDHLDKGVGVYFDAGPASGGQASTIVDLTGPAPRVLREGAIPTIEIDRVLAEPPLSDFLDDPMPDPPKDEPKDQSKDQD